ncbi:MAG: NnrS family protein, partial [Verrucomicrobiae bacterium]|nr:NnrS family protein [Verrucomicrobiae bacterium]
QDCRPSFLPMSAAKKPPAYQTLPTDAPIWVSEPFRVFFPLGIAAAVFGLVLWPLFYAGWWASYPAIQHPRLLIFGFGMAFIFGFLGTAWPRFLEAEALRPWELVGLVIAWLAAQAAYLLNQIRTGDLIAGVACLLLLTILGRRLFGRENRDLPPPGFALAFVSVMMTTVVLLIWAAGKGEASVPTHLFTHVVAYQGFLLFPILGVGSYLFGRFFQVPGKRPPAKPPYRAAAVWGSAAVMLISFAFESFGWIRTGNGLRLMGFAIWALGAIPGIWKLPAPNTRAWALRIGLCMLPVGFLCRLLWPNQLFVFGFEHLLFLGAFSLVMLLTADRVILGHCDDPKAIPPKSKHWRWMLWLILLAAATRATADLVPSTRTSHHIYAALTLCAVLIIWLAHHGRRLRRQPPEES